MNGFLCRRLDSVRYNARFAISGCLQKIRSYYNKTCNSFVGTSLLRILFALTITTVTVIMKFDSTIDFLYGHLSDNFYILMAHGYKDKNKVFHLRKSLSGIKQALLWNERF